MRLPHVLSAALFVVMALPLGARQTNGSPHGTLPEDLDCAACHTPEGWTPLREPMDFDHDARVGFTLTGAHQDVTCVGCHEALRFDAPEVSMADCASCHRDPHEAQMVRDCADCHQTRSFQEIDGETLHSRTSFPLTGAHRQVTCESCHIDDVGGSYSPLESDCMSCHAEDYDGALTVDHEANGYPTDCTECHNTLGWNDAPDFDHSQVGWGFTLVGAHDGLRCASCHQVPGMEPLFQPTGQNDCVSCHLPDYQEEHGGTTFPMTCLSCHGVESWDVTDFDHDFAGFPLVERHGQLSCSECHTEGSNELKFPSPTGPEDCVACHQADYDDEHRDSGFPTTCLECHTQRDWEASSFNHSTTSFLLEGPHAVPECSACHTPPTATAALVSGPEDCVVCHQGEYDTSHAGSDISTQCAECHSGDTWEGAEFDHAQASFALEGVHAAAACETCHTVPDYGLRFPSPTGQDDCVACHQGEYDTNHAGSEIPTACTQCHSGDTWEGAEFDHAQASFALEGVHAAAACETCHTVPDYGLRFPSPTGQDDCVACHQGEYDTNHAGSGFPTTCADCHSGDTWEGATADHVALSGGFALEGVHATAACETCHTVPDYGLLFPSPTGPNDCVACHQGEYDTNHAGSSFPTTCLDCHSGDTWEGATADHVALSGGFALEGVHATAACETCHTVPDYGLLFPSPTGPEDCVACHQGEYDTNHSGSSFPTTCLDCHTGDTWLDATADHVALSGGFALEGVHATAACETCHSVPDYGLLFPSPAGPEDCVACHQGEYDTNHAGSGFPTTCLDCHTGDTWLDATVDHVALSGGFALEGVHATAACETCHKVPDYGLLFPSPAGPEDCVACHQGEYDTNHAGSNFPTTCLDCHTGDTWLDATADHVALSGGFALEGVHATAACETCHSVPDYGLLFPSPAGPEDCVACHQGEYDTNHAGSGFPTTCLDCHTGDTWLDATVDHVALSGGFALEGVHATAACETCHSVPDYGLLFPSPAGPEDCVACHQGEYDTNHAGSGFPTMCLDCHTVQAWSPSTFDHDAQYFPIYSGKHAQEWSDCSDCHNNPTNIAQIYCLSCHEHRKEKMDDTHSGEPDYTYTTAGCLTCHPRGES